jgi:multiple sugar transport system permease protein/raffinose/stachyose/melibiose transport system permease protein
MSAAQGQAGDPRPARMHASLLLGPRGSKRSRAGSMWPFALPIAVAVASLYFLPLLINGYLAFTDWSGFHSSISFTGLDNLQTLFEQYDLPDQLRLTVIYAVTASLIGNLLALGLALALEKPTRTNQFFRAAFFIPVLLSPLAAGYVWAGILDPAGPLNQAISTVVPGFGFAWLGSSTLAIFLVAAVDAWKWCGFFTLIYIAGLSTVPQELKEAAVAMGANRWQVFRNVKLPFLAPAITYNVTVTVIGAMSTFDIILATTRGGPGNATRVLNVLTLDQFGIGYFGLASATQLVVTVLVTITAIPLIWFLRRRELEG